MAKVIATDLDGTLFYPKARIRMISPKSLKFLRNFIDEGGKVVLVSGRNLAYTKKVVEKIKRPVDVIGCNSSYIMSDGELIKESFFEPGRIREILRELDEEYHPKAVLMMAGESNFICKQSFKSAFYSLGYKLWYFFQGVYREKFYLNDQKFYEALDTGKIYKIMLMFGVGKKAKVAAMEANKKIREKYKDEIEASWSDEAIEISPKDCSKANGLKYYLNYHKINASDIYVVGDSGNDISMFNEFYENSFCMMRAALSVSKHANHVIKHFWELEEYVKKGSN